MWPAFKRYFITAQLIVGLTVGGQGIIHAIREPGFPWYDVPLFFLAGFAAPIPLVALVVACKVLLDRHFPRKEPLRTNVVGAVLVGLSICAVMVGLALIAR